MLVDTLGAAGAAGVAGAGWVASEDAPCFFRRFFPSFFPPIVSKLLDGRDAVPAFALIVETDGIDCPKNGVDSDGDPHFLELESWS